MNRNAILILAACLMLPGATASAQIMSARRMAMGGVTLGGATYNVAYRAVPKPTGRSSGFTLPIGLAQVLSNPPEFDPNQPGFNAWKIVSLVENPPWNYQLRTPTVPSSDVTISIGKDQLAVDLGDVRNFLPRDGATTKAFATTPIVGFGVKKFFLSAGLMTDVENQLGYNDALRGALLDAQDFQPLTTYSLLDDGHAQAIGTVQAGGALPLSVSGNPRAKDGHGLYGGVRASFLRGVAYSDVHTSGSFTTKDTLFGSSPVEMDYTGDFMSAGPNGGGTGLGVDVGAVMLKGGTEVGVGVNNLGAKVKWTGTHKQAVKDSSGNYQTVTVDDNAAFTTTIPTMLVVNAAQRIGSLIVAVDATNSMNVTQAHVGAEKWFNRFALRAGGHIDARGLPQGSVGAGLKVGAFGLDAALASNSLAFGGNQRGLELGLGVSLYH